MDELLTKIYQQLGISSKHLELNKLPIHRQPSLDLLEVVDIDFEGKPFILISSAAQNWRRMKVMAQRDNISLMPFSGFRSYLHQMNLIDRHLKNGRPIEDILTHIAIPGFSEHHSGRAIDIHTKGKNILDEEFESTEEFIWLSKNAAQFEFRLSYPRSNSFGIIYEPWHWFYTGN